MHWSGPHLHMVLNHFPSVGVVIALGLFVGAMYLRNEEMKRAALLLYVILGLLAVPTYISGAASRWALRGQPDVSADLIAAHMDAALVACILLGFMGVIAWYALWQARRFAAPPNWPVYTATGLAVLALLVMVDVGNLGGQINHPEIRVDLALAGEGTGRTAAIEGFVRDFGWSWPALEAAHFIGMALLFGVVLLVCLRVLGLGKEVAFPSLHRLLPLGAFGVIVNILTGMVFFIADSGRYTAMDGFPPKITFLVIGTLAMLYFTLFDGAWKLKAGENASVTSKIMAGVTVAAWVGVIAMGRLLPYFGEGPGG